MQAIRHVNLLFSAAVLTKTATVAASENTFSLLLSQAMAAGYHTLLV